MANKMDENIQSGIVDYFNGLISDLMVLYQKLRNYHWNVEGTNFGPLHKFFQDLYEGLTDDIDDVAERVRAIGSNPASTLAEFLEKSNLKEGKFNISDNEMLSDLSDDYSHVINSVREASDEVSKDDLVSQNLLLDLGQKYEKNLWMINSYLEGKISFNLKKTISSNKNVENKRKNVHLEKFPVEPFKRCLPYGG